MLYYEWKEVINQESIIANSYKVVVVKDEVLSSVGDMSVSGVTCGMNCGCGDILVHTFDNNLSKKLTLGEMNKDILNLSYIDDDSTVFIQNYNGEYTALQYIEISDDSIIFTI